MAEQNLISASRQSDFYDFYTDDYCNKLRRRTFSKESPAKGEARPRKPHGLLIWRFLFYLLLIPTIIAVGATIPALQSIYQRGAELLSIPSLVKFEPSERAKEISGFLGKNIDTIQDSGKKNGFKCLIYMHRYREDTIARIRTDYVHEQQSRYRTAIADLEQRMGGASTSERVKLSKQLAKLQAQAEEIRVYEEKIHHLADQMIKIDLDDGVKHNYEIFKDVLAKIK